MTHGTPESGIARDATAHESDAAHLEREARQAAEDARAALQAEQAAAERLKQARKALAPLRGTEEELDAEIASTAAMRDAELSRIAGDIAAARALRHRPRDAAHRRTLLAFTGYRVEARALQREAVKTLLATDPWTTESTTASVPSTTSDNPGRLRRLLRRIAGRPRSTAATGTASDPDTRRNGQTARRPVRRFREIWRTAAQAEAARRGLDPKRVITPVETDRAHDTHAGRAS